MSEFAFEEVSGVIRAARAPDRAPDREAAGDASGSRVSGDARSGFAEGRSGFAEGRGGFAEEGRGAERRRRPARGKAEAAIRALLGMAALAAIAAALAVLVPPFLRVTRYDIAGTVTMSRDEVLSAALVHGTEYFFSVDPRRMELALAADPRIASARVARAFPNRLRIAITERTPVAAILVEIGGRPAAILLDAEGVAFGEGEAEILAGLPVVSGLRFEGFRLGQRLPPSLVPLLATIGEIQAKEPALLAAFSEIRVSKPRYGEPELILYPIRHRLPVRASTALNASTLRSIILVLEVLGTRGIADSVEEIDFRTGTVVYRSKEGQSG